MTLTVHVVQKYALLPLSPSPWKRESCVSISYSCDPMWQFITFFSGFRCLFHMLYLWNKLIGPLQKKEKVKVTNILINSQVPEYTRHFTLSSNFHISPAPASPLRGSQELILQRQKMQLRHCSSFTTFCFLDSNTSLSFHLAIEFLPKV